MYKRQILDRNPDAVVYCTTAAKNYLTSQLNRDFKFKTIKDGEVLNIGKRNLRFITAPMPVSYTHLDVYKRQVLRTGFVQLQSTRRLIIKENIYLN